MFFVVDSPLKGKEYDKGSDWFKERKDCQEGRQDMEHNLEMRQEHSQCEEKTKQTLYQIGMFAAMNHVTVKALRFYEEQGLLLPAHVDEESGYRYYTMPQMANVQQILALKEAGFKLEEIKEIRRSGKKDRVLLKKKNEILEEMARLTAKLAKLEGYMNEDSMSIDVPVRVRTIPETVTAVKRCRIETYDCLFELMPELGSEMEKLGCKCALPEYCFTNYLEPGYKADDIPVEICEAVTEKKEDTEQVKFKVFPQVEAACVFHKGSYRELARTYEAALRFIEDNHYTICGGIREKYIDGVWNKDSESEWLTEIQIPVMKRQKEGGKE